MTSASKRKSKPKSKRQPRAKPGQLLRVAFRIAEPVALHRFRYPTPHPWSCGGSTGGVATFLAYVEDLAHVPLLFPDARDILLLGNHEGLYPFYADPHMRLPTWVTNNPTAYGHCERTGMYPNGELYVDCPLPRIGKSTRSRCVRA